MKISQRGTYKTLVEDDGSPVIITFSTIVFVVPWEKNGKTYVRVKATDDIFQIVDDIIRRAEPDLEFSPFAREGVTLKVAAKGLIGDVSVAEQVQVTAKLGNFGKFGYCWNVSSLFAWPIPQIPPT